MTITWTDTQRLALIRIIGEWIMNSDDLWETGSDWGQLIVFLSSMPDKFLENNRSKFAEAIAEYEKEAAQ